VADPSHEELQRMRGLIVDAPSVRPHGLTTVRRRDQERGRHSRAAGPARAEESGSRGPGAERFATPTGEARLQPGLLVVGVPVRHASWERNVSSRARRWSMCGSPCVPNAAADLVGPG